MRYSPLMKIAIFGAGAIGSYLGVRLHQAGRRGQSDRARGTQLEAMKRNGVTLKSGDESTTVRPLITDDPEKTQAFRIMSSSA